MTPFLKKIAKSENSLGLKMQWREEIINFMSSGKVKIIGLIDGSIKKDIII